MNRLAYYRPHGAAYGPVTYLVIPHGPSRWHGYKDVPTVKEDGSAGAPLKVHREQVMDIPRATHDVLLRTLRAIASERGESLSDYELSAHGGP